MATPRVPKTLWYWLLIRSAANRSACFTCVIASFGFSCSETPRTSAGAPRLSFLRTVLCVLKGRDTTIAFLVSMADCRRPLRNAAAKWSNVSRLMGRSSGKGSCRPSMVLNPTWGRRSRLPVTRREIRRQRGGTSTSILDTTSDLAFQEQRQCTDRICCDSKREGSGKCYVRIQQSPLGHI